MPLSYGFYILTDAIAENNMRGMMLRQQQTRQLRWFPVVAAVLLCCTSVFTECNARTVLEDKPRSGAIVLQQCLALHTAVPPSLAFLYS
jgi:hypothetical protein